MNTWQMKWPAWFGLLFFIGMMSAGYYYNLTFVQFGLIDLGVRLVGMETRQVVTAMALLALITSLVSVVTGLGMMKLGWSASFYIKLRLAFGVILGLTVLTGAAPAIRTGTGFLTWIVLASAALGIAVPVTFGLTVDLVPVRLRGYAGAFITAAAYFPAAVLSPDWTVENFASGLVWLMAGGAAVLGVMAFAPLGFIRQLAAHHSQPSYAHGRFIRRGRDGTPYVRRSLVVLFVLMFGIYFVDSLGFLRLAETPYFFEAAWQSQELQPRLVIGITHVIAALVAGVLYRALSEKELFLWIFGIFGLVHLMYSLSLRGVSASGPTLSEPVMYAVAVSLYTVINFAIWADISTPHTITRNTALGVALSAWTATFFSTALALQMSEMGIPLETHLRIVDSLAFLFFLLVAGLVFFAPLGRPKKGIPSP
jgi:hypothetical protein